MLLSVPDPFAIRELIPDSKTLLHTDYNIAVKYSLAAARLLRNRGEEAPSPIQLDYAWPGKYRPWDHQRTMAEFLTFNKRGFNLSDMGTGKSAAALWTADYLMRTGVVRKTLILSPLSTLERVWMSDIFDVLMHRTASLVYGTREQRLKALEVNADFYVLNHDGITIKDVHAAIYTNPDINLVIVDEASMFRNHDTKKYKALARLLRPDMRVWLMTATPCPNSPTDAWALARLVAPDRVPKFFGAFQRQTMTKVSTFKWVPRLDAYSIAYDAMQPAVRFRKADCLDLPPITYEDRQAEMTPDQRRMFEQMRIQMKAEAKTTRVDAVNAADKIGKLRQILCGAVKDPASDKYITLPHGPRLQVLLDCIEQASAKVLVIAPFKGIARVLEEEVGKHHSVALLNGDVTIPRRNKIIQEFKSGPDPRVLVCHPKVMAHGLNLTEADTLIFYAPIYSNDEFQQVSERFNRAGQVNKMTVVKIAAHPLEWAIYTLLANRKDTQDNILNLYKSITE